LRELSHLLLRTLQEASSARPLVPVDLLSILKKRFPGLSSEDALDEVTALAAEGLVTVRTAGVSLTQEGLAAIHELPGPPAGLASERVGQQRRRANASDELNLDQIVELMNSADRDSEPPRPPRLPSSSRRRPPQSPDTQPPPRRPDATTRNISEVDTRALAPPEPVRSTLPPVPPEVPEEYEEESDDLLKAWRNAARPMDPAEAAAQAAHAAQAAQAQAVQAAQAAQAAAQQYYAGTPNPPVWASPPMSGAAAPQMIAVPQLAPMQLGLDPNSPAARLVRLRTEVEILTREIAASGNLPLEIFAEALQLTGQAQAALDALQRLLFGGM
jgi:hypothetical protein